MTNLKPGDLTVMGHWLVEYAGEHTCGGTGPNGHYGAHESGCGYEPLADLTGMSPTERIAVVLDHTAALGTPEVVYRRNAGESIPDAAARLRAEVMQKAEDVLRVVLATQEAR